jgi:hypothetical protein
MRFFYGIVNGAAGDAGKRGAIIFSVYFLEGKPQGTLL